MDNHPLGKLTQAGRVLAVAAIFLAAGGTFAWIEWCYDDLPPGGYPVFFFALPAVFVALVFFVVGSLVLRACGVPIYNDRNEVRPAVTGPAGGDSEPCADLWVSQDQIDNSEAVVFTTPNGVQRTVRLHPIMTDGVIVRLRGMGPGATDLHVRVRVTQRETDVTGRPGA